MKHTATLVAAIAGLALGLFVGFHRNPPEPPAEIVIPANPVPPAPIPPPAPAPSTPSPELSETPPEIPRKASQRPPADPSLRTKLTQKRILQEAQLETLSSYDGDQLYLYAASMDTPENLVKSLYPQLQDAKQNLGQMTSSGLGPRHPSVLAQQSFIASVQNDLDSATARLRDLLKMQIDTANSALQNLPADH